MMDTDPAHSGSGVESHHSRSLVQRLGSALWLLAVWVGIRGSMTVGSLLGGVVCVSVIMVLFRQGGTISSSRHRINPLWLAIYVGHFLKELIKANVEVAGAVMSPAKIEDRRGIIRVELPYSSRLIGSVLANAVSLTPGTSIIEVSDDPPALHVHVLNLSDPDVVRLSIAELHWRLVKALGPIEALGAVEVHREELKARLALNQVNIGAHR